MSYYILKWPNDGPVFEYTLDKIKRELTEGKLDKNCAVRRDEDQQWTRLGDLFNYPSETTLCFIVVGDRRQGPYLAEQIRTMWRSGSITADAWLSWEEHATPTPISVLMNNPLFGNSTDASPNIERRVTITLLGGGTGLLASYLMRPNILGHGPSLRDWFAEGFDSPFASTIMTCGIIGLVIGFIIGHVMDENVQRK